MYSSWLDRYNLLIFDEIDSTSSEAIRLARAGVAGDFIIWAKRQTAGRGRYSRVWYSEAGNLYVTILLNRNVQITKRSQLSFVTALALHKAIISFAQQYKTAFQVRLKWPNDILIEGKKAAGILLESIDLDSNNYIIVGVGVNLQSNPSELRQLVTNLYAYGININAEQMLCCFIRYFEKYLLLWQYSGFMPIRDQWLQKASNLQQVISIDDGKNKISGVLLGIDFEGNLCLKSSSGEIHIISTGEVLFRQ